MNEYARFESCLVCGSARLSDLTRYRADFLVRCRDCHFVFCNRKPSAGELLAHYGSYRRGNAISPITLKRYGDLCDRFDAYRKTNNILDVGCGDGHFLAEAKKRGWNVFGTEFTREAIEICERKGIHMSEGSLSSTSFPAGYFDVITSFEVIEHINNPAEEAHTHSILLRAGGLLYVTTPNFNSVSRTLLGPRWNIIEYPEHLCYFTRKTLKRLFQSSGYDVQRITSTGISIDRIRRGLQKVNLAAGKDVDEKLREKTEHALFHLLKTIVNLFLNLLGKGDALKASFIKK